MRQRVSFVNKVTSEHSFRFHWFALLLYSALAIGMTLPLALQMSDHLLGTDSNALNDTFSASGFLVGKRTS